MDHDDILVVLMHACAQDREATVKADEHWYQGRVHNVGQGFVEIGDDVLRLKDVQDAAFSQDHPVADHEDDLARAGRALGRMADMSLAQQILARRQFS